MNIKNIFCVLIVSTIAISFVSIAQVKKIIKIKKEDARCVIHEKSEKPIYSRKITQHQLYEYRKEYKKSFVTYLISKFNNKDISSEQSCTIKLNQCLGGELVQFKVLKCTGSKFKKHLETNLASIMKLPLAPHKIVWSPQKYIRVTSEMLRPDYDYIATESLRRHHMRKYVLEISKLIRAKWNKPIELPADQTCMIVIQQEESGKVLNYALKKCRNERLKKSVIRVMNKIHYLPKPKDESLFDREIQFTFHSNENAW